MKTKYFTFGQQHTHTFNGVTLDKEVVVKITAKNPRETMVELFDIKWAFEYDEKTQIKHFPRGVFDINKSEFEQ